MILKISLRAKACVPKTRLKRKHHLYSLYFHQNTLMLTESRGEFSDLHSLFRRCALRYWGGLNLKRPLRDKLKLMCVKGTKTVGKQVGNCWQQIELASILANFFANFFVLVNSNLTCERLAKMCW